MVDGVYYFYIAQNIVDVAKFSKKSGKIALTILKEVLLLIIVTGRSQMQASEGSGVLAPGSIYYRFLNFVLDIF
jgi:hypothetical protein